MMPQVPQNQLKKIEGLDVGKKPHHGLGSAAISLKSVA